MAKTTIRQKQATIHKVRESAAQYQLWFEEGKIGPGAAAKAREHLARHEAELASMKGAK